MPRANPESCFEVAARHLFRHINDAKSLRYNPLVRSLHAGAEKGGGDRAVLSALHGRILTEASTLCKDYSAAGSKERAHRQYAIVVALCAGETAAYTAAQLGLSRRQYYRERRGICMRVSRALVAVAPTRVTRFEIGDQQHCCWRAPTRCSIKVSPDAPCIYLAKLELLFRQALPGRQCNCALPRH